jgi:hypothetical protein
MMLSSITRPHIFPHKSSEKILPRWFVFQTALIQALRKKVHQSNIQALRKIIALRQQKGNPPQAGASDG